MTPLCYLTLSQSENCAQADHRSCEPPLSPDFEECFAETLWEALGFLEQEPPVFLHDPAINLSLLQTLIFQFVWPHCASGAQICFNDGKWPSVPHGNRGETQAAD